MWLFSINLDLMHWVRLPSLSRVITLEMQHYQPLLLNPLASITPWHHLKASYTWRVIFHLYPSPVTGRVQHNTTECGNFGLLLCESVAFFVFLRIPGRWCFVVHFPVLIMLSQQLKVTTHWASSHVRLIVLDLLSDASLLCKVCKGSHQCRQDNEQSFCVDWEK